MQDRDTITAGCGCWFVFAVTLFCWSDLLIVAVQGWITECCFQWYHTGIGIETLRSFWLLLLWNGKHSLRVSLPSRQPTSGFCYRCFSVSGTLLPTRNRCLLSQPIDLAASMLNWFNEFHIHYTCLPFWRVWMFWLFADAWWLTPICASVCEKPSLLCSLFGRCSQHRYLWCWSLSRPDEHLPLLMTGTVACLSIGLGWVSASVILRVRLQTTSFDCVPDVACLASICWGLSSECLLITDTVCCLGSCIQCCCLAYWRICHTSVGL